MDPSENSASPHDERNRHRRARKKSPSMTPIHGKQDNVNDTDEEESVESMDDKFPLVRDPRELSVECKDDVDEELQSADGSPDTVKDEVISGTHKDESSLNPMKTGKIRSEVEQWKLQELDEDEDSRVARSSENSKARSGSSRDYQKWLDGAEDEVVQGEHSCIGIVKKHLHEHDQIFRRNDRDGRHDIEINRMAGKSGDDSYPLRDFDASLSHNMRVETDGFISRRESENPDGTLQWREDDLYGRKNRTGDLRKRDCDNGMGSRNRAKVRESDWSHKDDCPHRRQSDNGSYKDVSARHRERDDNLKSRYEAANDYHSKRRKDEEYLKRDHADKEGIMHGPRESSSSRRKRERDEILDPRRRDEQLRIRDNFEEHQSARHKDEVWLHRERVERQRERDGWDRLKGKENTRKNRDSVPGNTITLSSSRKSQEDLSGHNNETGLKSDEKNQIRHNSSRKHSEDVSLDDEQQESKRGRSKLESWTSHTEKDDSINSKSSDSLKFKEIDKINNVVSSESNKIADGPGKSVELAENHYPPLSDNKYVNEPEIKDADTRPLEDQHLDTVEKLKKRSERFKLPMPREKDAPEIKTESETQPSVKNETPVDSEIKHERPACPVPHILKWSLYDSQDGDLPQLPSYLICYCNKAAAIIKDEELVLMLMTFNADSLKFEEKPGAEH
ncbi:Detected protein of confused Function [Hibiscus syriacus]|uniref:Detected protein of confused Function n=1 Tax=Hibiscus syriacus TaxID=106335 RepID=A0A6A2ZZL5_HIBSY|nr:Detected protein of confused Function [Hibiscus syriacus]